MKGKYVEIIFIILFVLIISSCVRLGITRSEKENLFEYLDKTDTTLQLMVDTIDNMTEQIIENEEEIRKLKIKIEELENRLRLNED
jgi:peptidoglycan hydrolase CwlO-like protein